MIFRGDLRVPNCGCGDTTCNMITIHTNTRVFPEEIENILMKAQEEKRFISINLKKIIVLDYEIVEHQ